MGVSIHYWAIPPSSTLFERLQSDTAFLALMGFLFPYGNGIFFFFEEIDADEREEILQDVIDSQALGPEPETRRRIDEFRLELDRTRRAYPGIEERCRSLEKTCFLIEERLREALKDVRADASELVHSLLYGNRMVRVLDQDVRRPEEIAADPATFAATFISPSLVQEGAQVLSGLDAEAVFINDDPDWELAQFRHWRNLYVEAAAHGDALFCGVC